MRELICKLLLGSISGHNNHTSENDKSNVNDINDDMSEESMQITRRIIVPENLGCNQIANSPADKEHSHGEAFLRLTGNIPGDERDDHVALGWEELCAIEGD